MNEISGKNSKKSINGILNISINLYAMKPKAIVFDLDGTLCLKEEWGMYNYNLEDTVNTELRSILNEYRMKNYRIIILTGRKANDHLIETQVWLNNNYILYDRLYLQEWNTAKQNAVYKKEKLQLLQQEFDIVLMYDDYPEIEKVCQELRIPFTLVTH